MVKYNQDKPRAANRVTQSIKENVVLTFELLGGVHEYAAWAKKNPDKFYDHWIKMLPAEIKAEVSVTHDFTDILERARTRVGTGASDQPRDLEAIADSVKQEVLDAVIDGEALPVYDS